MDHAQEFPFTVGAIFANLIHELPSLVVSDNFNQILYTKKEVQRPLAATWHWNVFFMMIMLGYV